MNRGVELLLVALIVAGCAGAAGPSRGASSGAPVSSPVSLPNAVVSPFPTQPAFEVYVDDVDGPPVDVLIGGHVVASVPCGGGAILVPGVSGVPSLPWSLDVRRQGGAMLKHFDVAGGGYLMLLLRSDTIALGSFASDGPAPLPSACAQWDA